MHHGPTGASTIQLAEVVVLEGEGAEATGFLAGLEEDFRAGPDLGEGI